MSTEERLVKLEGFAADVREFTQVLTEMIRRHDERLDEHATMFSESDRSIAALASAQINTEEAITRLTERTDEHAQLLDEANRSIAALASAQIRTDEAITRLTERLDAMIERLDRERNGSE